MSSLKSCLVGLLCALGAAAQTTNSTTVRYMPFGDSITEITCWRSLVWQRLQSATGYSGSAVDFQGSGRNDNNCAVSGYDKDNEGHSGFLAVDIVSKNQLVGWLKAAQGGPPDVITMHLGTNDVVQRGVATDKIIAAFTTLVGQMRASNPKMKIIVAQIIPLGIGNYNTQIQALNKAIPGWATGLNSTASPIYVVDQYTGFSGSADLRDGVHPNASGDKKMADVWYPALMHAFELTKAEKAAA